MSEASNPNTFAAVFFVIRPFVLPRTMLPGSLMNQLWWWMRWHNWAWSTSCFRHWGIGIRKSYPSNGTILRGEKACASLFFQFGNDQRFISSRPSANKKSILLTSMVLGKIAFWRYFHKQSIPWRFLDITLFHVRIPSHVLRVQKNHVIGRLKPWPLTCMVSPDIYRSLAFLGRVSPGTVEVLSSVGFSLGGRDSTSP